MKDINVALITGANKGIGFETARQLGKLGYKVIVGARDAQLGASAVEQLIKEDITAEFLLLDVTNIDIIKNAVHNIDEKYQRLDVLINNAGTFLEKGIAPSQLDIHTLKKTFDVNFFGVFETTIAFLPLIKKSKSGRIVNVSSGQGSLTNGSVAEAPRLQLAYNCSKAALNMLTIQLSKELADTPIKINSAAPGYTITDMNEGKGKRTVQESSKIIVELATLDENGTTGGFFDDSGKVQW